MEMAFLDSYADLIDAPRREIKLFYAKAKFEDTIGSAKEKGLEEELTELFNNVLERNDDDN